MSDIIIPEYCLMAHQRLAGLESDSAHSREMIARVEAKVDQVLERTRAVETLAQHTKMRLAIWGSVGGVVAAAIATAAKVVL